MNVPCFPHALTYRRVRGNLYLRFEGHVGRSIHWVAMATGEAGTKVEREADGDEHQQSHESQWYDEGGAVVAGTLVCIG